MKKIISLFVRDYDGNHLVLDRVTLGAEWVVSGEGVGTVKIDGTSCLVRDGKLFKRYDAKAFTIGPSGEKQPWNRVPPIGFEPAQEPDPVTGHWPGWIPVGDEPDSRWHREAAERYNLSALSGTYELVGPKVGGNPYGLLEHDLIKHGAWQFEEQPPRTFSELKTWFESNVVEGIVWHRANGDMVKIKRRDFGMKWPE